MGRIHTPRCVSCLWEQCEASELISCIRRLSAHSARAATGSRARICTPPYVERAIRLPNTSTKIITVLQKPYKPTDITIQNVTRFAYAQMDDGAYTLWALGEAGWFTIAGPATHYQSTYDADIQAVELLYFLIDCYTETPRKKGGGPSASLLYREVSG